MDQFEEKKIFKQKIKILHVLKYKIDKKNMKMHVYIFRE